MNAEDLAGLIRSRRTIHHFDSHPVPVELLLQAIDLARWAPNHKLTEPWQFHLLGPESVQQIVELNAGLVRATKGDAAAQEKRRRWSEMPGWFVLSCRRSEDALRSEEDYAASCCAAQNLSLWLWSHGVGVKWTTGDVIRHPEFFRLLELDPARHRVVGLFWYGTPAEIPTQTRQPAERVVVRHA